MEKEKLCKGGGIIKLFLGRIGEKGLQQERIEKKMGLVQILMGQTRIRMVKTFLCLFFVKVIDGPRE